MADRTNHSIRFRVSGMTEVMTGNLPDEVSIVMQVNVRVVVGNGIQDDVNQVVGVFDPSIRHQLIMEHVEDPQEEIVWSLFGIEEERLVMKGGTHGGVQLRTASYATTLEFLS